MNTRRILICTLRWATSATLAVSGYIHAQLWGEEYHSLPVIGLLFLFQAGVSFAFAVLLLIGTPPLALRVGAAGVAAGALAGFIASRTVGLFGFTEHGLQPAPQALLSLLAETATLLLLAVWQATLIAQERAAGPPARTHEWRPPATRTPPN
ncbi:hypothetical protein ACFVHS_28695 [Streptomyces sp. NPDC057746]|uniref:hypothetical protein n=1 Tax=unclassified Streptomyces TaxID=2593676 RepID=UPI0033E1A29B